MDFHLQNEPWDIVPHPSLCGAVALVVPAVAEDHAGRIFVCIQIFGNVKSVVQNTCGGLVVIRIRHVAQVPAVVICRTRRQNIITNLFAV